MSGPSIMIMKKITILKCCRILAASATAASSSSALITSFLILPINAWHILQIKVHCFISCNETACRCPYGLLDRCSSNELSRAIVQSVPPFSSFSLRLLAALCHRLRRLPSCSVCQQSRPWCLLAPLPPASKISFVRRHTRPQWMGVCMLNST